MRYVLCLLLTCLLMFLFSWVSTSGVTALKSNAAEAAEDIGANAAAVEAINAFAIDVYRQLAAEGGNIFFSPYSISSALAMTYAGAKGDTAEEMAKALHFTGRETEIHAAMASLQNRLGSIPGETGSLDVANRLWLDKREKLTPEYEALTRENYDAGV